MTTTISLGAGKSDRFSGIQKYKLIVQGEPLLERAAKQFGHVTLIRNSDIPNTRCTCDSFILSSDRWKGFGHIIVILADVCFSNATAHRILNCERELAFFTDTQDIFAIKFDYDVGMDLLIPNAREVIETGMHNKGRLWEMYRKMLRLPDTAGLPPQSNLFLELVADETQDFDSDSEYHGFVLEKQFKNKLFGK